VDITKNTVISTNKKSAPAALAPTNNPNNKHTEVVINNVLPSIRIIIN